MKQNITKLSLGLFFLIIILSSCSSQTEADKVKIKEQGSAFLAENRKKEGINISKSGLQYKIIHSGKGQQAILTSNVTVHYRGTFINGEEFDSSYKRDKPTTFPVNGVIKGWTEALLKMREGDKWEIYIPYNLAYGEDGAGRKIPGYSTLIFEVELLKVN